MSRTDGLATIQSCDHSDLGSRWAASPGLGCRLLQ
eukprot:COSAG02_NODE_18823_length_916_cov_1.768666_2_plen_34_part_01